MGSAHCGSGSPRCDTLLFSSPTDRATITLSPASVVIAAGVHGDERAAPWALLSLVGDGLLDPAFRYRLWPCTNPTGYEAGTRVSADGLDINRTFSIPPRSPEAATIAAVNRAERAVLSLDMHEDFEGTGFYCYEPAVDPDAPYWASYSS